MGEIDGDFYEWNENNAKNIPAQSGVYGLYETTNGTRRLIYIGSSYWGKLQRSFQETAN